MATKYHTTTLRIPDDRVDMLDELVEQEREQTGRSISRSDLINEAILDYLRKHKMLKAVAR